VHELFDEDRVLSEVGAVFLLNSLVNGEARCLWLGRGVILDLQRVGCAAAGDGGFHVVCGSANHPTFFFF